MPKLKKIKLSKTTSRDRARRSHLAGEIHRARANRHEPGNPHSPHIRSQTKSKYAQKYVDAGKKLPKGHRLKKASYSKSKLKKGFEKKTHEGSENRKWLAKEVRGERGKFGTGASPSRSTYRKMSSKVKKEGKIEAKKRSTHPILRAQKAGFRYPL